MSEIPTTPIQPLTSERSRRVYRLDPPPLLTDNEEMVATLESFGLKVIKQTDPPSLPTQMDLGHVPEEEREEALHFLRQISRYPRMPQILYPGEEEIADQPLKLELAERNEWKKLEHKIFQEEGKMAYRALKESQLKGNAMSFVIMHTRMILKHLPEPVREKAKDLFEKSQNEEYATLTLKKRGEHNQKISNFALTVLGSFSK